MRLQKNFDLGYECGKNVNMHLSDTLFRADLPTTEHPSRAEFENMNADSFLPVSEGKLNKIQTATGEYTTLQLLKKTILDGWLEE